MAAQHTPRRPDAIRCPRDYPRNTRLDRDVARNQLFGPLLGVKRVTSRELVDRVNESFVTPSAHETIFYRYGHPQQGKDRYEWFIAARAPDGSLIPGSPEMGHEGEAGRLKLGYLLPDEFADDPETQANIKAAYEDRMAEYMASPVYIEKMKALGVHEPEAQPDNLEAAPDPTAPDPA